MRNRKSDSRMVFLNLFPNDTEGEGAGHSSYAMDFLSNGFKIRTNDAGFNEHTMIYMCFGQTMVGTNDCPATAR